MSKRKKPVAKKKKEVVVEEFYEDDTHEEESEKEVKKTESSYDSELMDEIIYRKRGPKRKLTMKNLNVTFRLDDSDVGDSCSSGEDIVYAPDETQSAQHTLNKPWIEKYRPTDIEDLVLDQGTFNKINKIIKDKNMPNIIITGVPGIGKTTTILCLAKNLLGKYFKEGALELNASDDRGVKTAQETIEYFCKKKIDMDDQYAQHKIILLDEADNMTKRAQQSISNLMEQYHGSTRFAFTCNNSSDIIEAIQSRCIIFRYCRLSHQQVKDKLTKICEIENITYTDDGLNSIVTTAQGDLRQAINNLQLTYNGYTDIIPENVYKLCDKPHPLVIQNIFTACSKKDIKDALVQLNELRDKGYSSSDISLSMINTLKTLPDDILTENMKIKYMQEISVTCLNISKGLNTPLQLSGCIAALCKL